MRWERIKKYCYDKSHKYYPFQGGRGVTICDEWLNDFEAVYAWADSQRYNRYLVIDLIDPYGQYCPENCRVVLPSERVDFTDEAAIALKAFRVEEVREQMARVQAMGHVEFSVWKEAWDSAWNDYFAKVEASAISEPTIHESSAVCTKGLGSLDTDMV